MCGVHNSLVRFRGCDRVVGSKPLQTRFTARARERSELPAPPGCLYRLRSGRSVRVAIEIAAQNTQQIVVAVGVQGRGLRPCSPTARIPPEGLRRSLHQPARIAVRNGRVAQTNGERLMHVVHGYGIEHTGRRMPARKRQHLLHHRASLQPAPRYPAAAKAEEGQQGPLEIPRVDALGILDGALYLR